MTRLVGVDEVNYSPSLAGDCVVCSYYRTGKKIKGVGDSKKLTHKKRVELFDGLTKEGLYYVVPATPNIINHINVYYSRNSAIVSSLVGLGMVIRQMELDLPDKVEIDGKWSQKWLSIFSETLGIPVEGIIRGDETVYEISAASIIARIYCDALFEGWESFFPGWGIGYDHGSVSEKHKQELWERGPSPVHRIGVYGNDWWRRLLPEEKFKGIFRDV